MFRLLILLILVAFIGNASGQSKIDSLFKENLTVLQNSISAIEKAGDARQQKLQQDLSDLKVSLQSTDQQETLAEKVKQIQQIFEKEREVEIGQLKERYSHAQLAVAEMEKGVTLITFMQNLLSLQQEINNIYDFWGDEDIRNGYDKASDILTIVGPLAGAAIAAGSGEMSTEAKVAAVGGGVATIGIAKLIAKLFGKEGAKKYEFIDMSRQAYDKLVIVNTKLEKYVEDNENFKHLIDTFKVDFLKAQKSLDDLSTDSGNIIQAKLTLNEVIELMDEYQTVLSHIPQYIYELQGVISSYTFTEYLKHDEKLKQTFELLKAKATSALTEYKSNVQPLLEVSPRLKVKIYDF